MFLCGFMILYFIFYHALQRVAKTNRVLTHLLEYQVVKETNQTSYCNRAAGLTPTPCTFVSPSPNSCRYLSAMAVSFFTTSG
jgi:hypothetical protein